MRRPCREPRGNDDGIYYVPVDPLEVAQLPHSQTCGVVATEETLALARGFSYRGLLDELPDAAVRLSISSVEAEAGVTFGPSSVGFEGQTTRSFST